MHGEMMTLMHAIKSCHQALLAVGCPQVISKYGPPILHFLAIFSGKRCQTQFIKLMVASFSLSLFSFPSHHYSIRVDTKPGQQ